LSVAWGIDRRGTAVEGTVPLIRSLGGGDGDLQRIRSKLILINHIVQIEIVSIRYGFPIQLFSTERIDEIDILYIG
jgi:hypothetical protein